MIFLTSLPVAELRNWLRFNELVTRRTSLQPQHVVNRATEGPERLWRQIAQAGGQGRAAGLQSDSFEPPLWRNPTMTLQDLMPRGIILVAIDGSKQRKDLAARLWPPSKKSANRLSSKVLHQHSHTATADVDAFTSQWDTQYPRCRIWKP